MCKLYTYCVNFYKYCVNICVFFAFTLFCRKIAVIPIFAFLCKFWPKNSGHVKVMTNVMSVADHRHGIQCNLYVSVSSKHFLLKSSTCLRWVNTFLVFRKGSLSKEKGFSEETTTQREKRKCKKKRQSGRLQQQQLIHNAFDTN